MSVEFLNSIRNFSSAVKNNDFSISIINPDSSYSIVGKLMVWSMFIDSFCKIQRVNPPLHIYGKAV